MIIGALVQARMASTRLPGKVLLPLQGKPMLAFQIERLKKSKKLASVAIATSTNPENKAILDLAQQLDIPAFAGSEEDVLDRCYQAAKQFTFDVIVRITGDCPLADPAVIDQVIDKFLADKADYANNVDPPTYPDGFDVEVFTFAALERAWKEAKAQHHREHVTAYIRETEGFRKAHVQSPVDLSKLRLTVDNKDDYEVVQKLVAVLPQDFSLQDVLKAIETHPELTTLNAQFVRDEKYLAQVRAWRKNMRTLDQSKSYLARAQERIPGLSQTLSKAPTQFIQGVHPYLIEHAKGCYVWDVDGNKYLDLTCSLGPITLGYNHPSTLNAVKEQLKKGTVFPLPHKLEIELAEVLKEIVPCAEMVRYGLNGSDATAAAVRLARAHTGRDHIAKCGYHGWQDWCISTNPGRSKGVPQAVKDLTHEFKYNDITSLKEIFDKHPGKIAAVVMEPMTVVEPQDDFLQKVKDMAHANGALLVFDEIVTGFRWALGGAQQHFNVIPDIAAMGKGVANGMPLSIVAGKKDVMQSFKDVFFSFTYGGEALALAAAMATIKVMRSEPVIEHIWKMGKLLQDGYNALAQKHNIPSQCVGLPPHTVFTFKDAAGNDDLILKSLFLQETVKRGVLTNASILISYAHQEMDIQKALRAIEGAFKVMRKALDEHKLVDYLEGPPVQPRARPQ